MTAAETYIRYVKQTVLTRPGAGWDQILLGLKANQYKVRLLPDRKVAKGYQRLEARMAALVSEGLGRPENCVWGNIFAPCEIMAAMGLTTLSVECLACYFAGFHLEDHFIDWAQNEGVAPTLCSYHKTFLGAVGSGVAAGPGFGVTTSLSCDGNLNTFRYLKEKTGAEYRFLDVPYREDEASVAYLAAQLKELSEELSRVFGRPFYEERLREILEIENETQKALWEFCQCMGSHFYPGKMMSQLYLMMGVHLMMGSREFLEIVKEMGREIRKQPPLQGKKIMWIHLMPAWQKALGGYFNSSPDHQLIASDIILDHMEPLDTERPFEALARKLISNIYNGSCERKAQRLCELAEAFGADGVIHFCPWGCKQASGGSILLKERLHALGIPVLILDGDGIDGRNSHEGQMLTRLEAFLEMVHRKENRV